MTGSRIGENVTVEAGAHVHESELRDTIVGAGATVDRCSLGGSIVGSHAVVQGFNGVLNVPDDSEVVGRDTRKRQS